MFFFYHRYFYGHQRKLSHQKLQRFSYFTAVVNKTKRHIFSVTFDHSYFTDVNKVLLTALKGIHLSSIDVFDQSLILIKIIKIIFLELLLLSLLLIWKKRSWSNGQTVRWISTIKKKSRFESHSERFGKEVILKKSVTNKIVIACNTFSILILLHQARW